MSRVGENNGSSEGLAAAVREVSDRAAGLARLEVELAKAELAQKAKRLGRGAGLAALAAVLGLFGLGFALAAAAAGLDEALPSWASYLIVGGALLGTAALLGLAGMRSIRASTPPVPEKAIAEARATAEALKHPTSLQEDER